MDRLKAWFYGSCVVATIILACILPALAVLSFVAFAALLIYSGDK